MRNRFAAAYCLELRLLCLHWSYWLLMAIYSGYMIASVVTRQPYPDAQSLLLYLLPMGILALVTLGILFMAAVSASRPQRNRIQLLEAAFPTGAEVVLARWSAVVTAAAGFLITPLGLALVSGPVAGFITSLPEFLTHSLVIFSLCAAVVWLAHVTVGIKRWMFPLFALLWVGGGLAGSLNIRQFPWALLLGFPVYAFSGTSYSTLWGLLREGSLPEWVTLFYAGLMLTLMSAVVWRTIRQRYHRPAWVVLSLGAAALGIALTGGIGYTTSIVSANAQESASNQFVLSQTPDYLTLPADLPYAVKSYDLTLDLARPAAPAFSVQMEVANLGDIPLGELDFSLNHQLEVTRLNLPFERNWDYLRLLPEQPLPPHGTLKIEVAYRGSIWWYGREVVQGASPHAEAFITPAGINLPCSIGWYPIPGRILIGRERMIPDRQTADCLLAQPANFTLQVINAMDLRFASNLPTTGSGAFSSPAAWVHLIAAPELATENAGQVTLISAQRELDLAQSVSRSYYVPAFEYLRHFFPDITHLTIFALDAGFGGEFFRLATPENAGSLTTVAPPYYLRTFAQSPFNEYWYVEQGLVESLFGQGDTALADNVAYFLHAHRQAQGDPIQIQAILSQGIPQGSAGGGFHTSQTIEERYAIAFALDEVYQKVGQTGLETLLAQIRARVKELSVQPQAAIIALIREAGYAH